MTKIVKSARGQVLDFDLLKIKQQLSESPAPTEVKARENFVEKRLKRKLRNKTVPAVLPPTEEDTAEEELAVIDATPITAQEAQPITKLAKVTTK